MDAVEFDVCLSSHVSERKRKTASLWCGDLKQQLIFSDRMVQIVHAHQLIKFLKFFCCMSCLKYIFQMLLKGWCILKSSQVINKSKWFVHPVCKAQPPSCPCIKRLFLHHFTIACYKSLFKFHQANLCYLCFKFLFEKKNQVENNSFRSDSKI